VPMYFTKVTGGSKYAERGAIVGLFAGMFLTPIGMVLGSFLLGYGYSSRQSGMVTVW
jgi:uncharacterized protein YqgC (DUF456 family)